MTVLCFALSSQPIVSAAPLAAVPAPPADFSKIGIVAAVKGEVEIKNTKLAGRIAENGTAVYIGDTVSTDAKGVLQILLLDETIFTIGPNSSIVIDQFVFDPSTNGGRVKATVVKGVFRFVTGKIARKNPSDMQVDLPSGSIGVRGTMVLGQTDGTQSTAVLLGPGSKTNTTHRIGQITVGNGTGGETKPVTISRPGYGSTISGPGAPPSEPFQVPKEQLAAMTSALEPPKGSADDDSGNKGGSGGSSGGEGEDSDPTADSGQGTAEGGEFAADADEAAAIALALGAESNQAAQEAFEGDDVDDGPAFFDELRRITTGVFHYNDDNVSMLTGGSSIGDTYDFDLDINFGNRTIGGTSNSKFVSTHSSGTKSAVYLIPSVSFANGDGPASFNQSIPPDASSVCISTCGNATVDVDLINDGGIIADTAKHEFTFVDMGVTYTGNGESDPRS